MKLELTSKPKEQRLIVGGPPRADLVPLEIRLLQRQHALRRILTTVLVGVICIAVLGYGGVSVASVQASVARDAAREETASLLLQQAKYADITQMEQRISAATAARLVASSTEIDWKSYLEKVNATLPAGVAITSINIDSASPTAPYEQSTIPLQGVRVASLTFHVLSPDLSSVQAWLDRLATLPGFSDAAPGLAVRNETGSYDADVILHIGAAAYANRYVDPTKAVPAASTTDASASDTSTAQAGVKP